MEFKSELLTIYNKFIELEEKNNLISFELKNVKIWQYLRLKIYKKIHRATELYGIDHTKKTGLFYLISKFPSLLYNSTIKNPLLGSYKKEILLFNSNRKAIINNSLKDIYTFSISDNIDPKRIEIYEEPYLFKHVVKSKKKLDFIIVNSLLKSFLFKTKFNKSEKDSIVEIQNLLNNSFDISINLVNLFARYITIFKTDYNFYLKLFKKRNPKVIFLTFSYESKKALLAAAKKLNIPTVELQHGTISKLHLGYDYHYAPELISYFPDYFLSFGKFWAEDVNLPINDNNIIDYGYPYFNTKLKNQKHLAKNKNQILFISQGTIGNTLSEIALDLALQKPQYRIIYKLHPGEFDRWKEEYPKLVEFSKLENCKVLDDKSVDLYELFAKSEIQIGVYSTAIFEGLALGCKTLVANLPGVENLQHLIDKNLVYCFKNTDELIKNIDAFTPAIYEQGYLFNQNNLQIQDILNIVLNKPK